ncbi:hypothetical protein GCU56_02395 [Geodermatophilus sabuli]|uniref:Uncharacterized protein n=1 Tax=Geodermatophilus sabuli TaxID=1564158 RepID=A0A7K3VVR8_9ACTN|nr:hypothetical protein [Geodermatophilus sabuli]NEK56726.1 hypothetical protein [Geodermatophilus sabuli]
MTTPRSTSAEHPEVPPPTGDAVPDTTRPDEAVQNPDAQGDDHPTAVFADAERADVAADEVDAARRHHR